MLTGGRRKDSRFQFVTKVAGGLSRIDGGRTPYGLEIIENCLACPHREERLFCNLSEAAIRSMALDNSCS